MAAGPKWKANEFVDQVAQLGVEGVELLPVEHWHLLEKHDLVCAATRSHSFVRGMCNTNHHPECLQALEQAIMASSRAGFPNVMTFTGFADTTGEEYGSKVSLEEGFENCVKGYKKIVGLAEQQGVSLILEPLNTKVDEEMKGHPGYLGDHVEFCIEIIKTVSSSALRLLFDVYHIQIMDGNVISNLEKNFEFIGHVQIAGVPGRGEIGEDQEINYRAVMKKLVELGYDGYVGHEWIPTRNAMDGLREAVEICNV